MNTKKTYVWLLLTLSNVLSFFPPSSKLNPGLQAFLSNKPHSQSMLCVIDQLLFLNTILQLFIIIVFNIYIEDLLHYCFLDPVLVTRDWSGATNKTTTKQTPTTETCTSLPQSNERFSPLLLQYLWQKLSCVSSLHSPTGHFLISTHAQQWECSLIRASCF